MSLQPLNALAEGRDSDGEIAQQPRSPYMTARETIEYLRLGSESSLYRLVRGHRLPTCRRGRLYLFDRREVDAWLRGANSALELVRAHRKHRAAVLPSSVSPKSGHGVSR